MIMSAPSARRFVDIGANLLDAQFRGRYGRGASARKHAPDLDAVLQRAAEAGVRAVVVTSSDLRDARAALRLCRRVNASGRHPHCRLFATVGVHPLSTRQLDFAEGPAPRGAGAAPAAPSEHDGGSSGSGGGGGSAGGGSKGGQQEGEEEDDNDDDDLAATASLPQPGDKAAYVAALREVLADGVSDGTVVAVGECGLDFEPSRLAHASAETQQRHFALHVDLAEEFRLPLFLHSRDTGGAFLALMREHGARIAAAGGGVVHSFDGSVDEMRELVDEHGLHIGLNGCSLRTAANLAAAGAAPAGRLLLETDAPWCGIKASGAGFASVRTQFPTVKKPERHDGGASCVKDRTEPCHIVQVCEVVAAARGAEVGELAEQVFAASVALFRLRGLWEGEEKG